MNGLSRNQPRNTADWGKSTVRQPAAARAQLCALVGVGRPGASIGGTPAGQHRPKACGGGRCWRRHLMAGRRRGAGPSFACPPEVLFPLGTGNQQRCRASAALGCSGQAHRVRHKDRRGPACSARQSIHRRHLGRGVDPAQVGGEATNDGKPGGRPASISVWGQYPSRPLQVSEGQRHRDALPRRAATAVRAIRRRRRYLRFLAAGPTRLPRAMLRIAAAVKRTSAP
jgi:hypothetical protein